MWIVAVFLSAWFIQLFICVLFGRFQVELLDPDFWPAAEVML